MAGYPFRPTRSSRAVLNCRPTLVIPGAPAGPRKARPDDRLRASRESILPIVAMDSGLVSLRSRPGMTTPTPSRFHQPRARPACDRILVAMRQRQIGFRTHLDQPRRGSLELIRLIAVGGDIQRQRIGLGGGH